MPRASQNHFFAITIRQTTCGFVFERSAKSKVWVLTQRGALVLTGEGNAVTNQAVKALVDLIRSRGQGVQRILQATTGVPEGMVSRLKTGDAKFSLSRFVEFSYGMGISPAALLKVPGEHILTAALPVPRKHERKPTPIETAVEAALERGEGSLTEDELTQRLEAIDELRYASPLDALEQLEALCADIQPRQAPYVLAVAASCFRLMARTSYASRCLFRGRQLAECTGDRLALGEMYQRSVYFFCSLGVPSIALDCAERATLVYTGLDHRQKIGESLVDQGHCFFYLHRYDDCLGANADAARFQRDLGLRNRVARLHAIASAFYRLGRKDEALDFTRRATAEGLDGTPHMRGKVLWTEGAALGFAGISKIEHAIDILLETLPMDAALASVDLGQIYLAAERFGEAHKVARRMTLFVEPFRHVPAVSNALRELVLIGTAAQGLTMARLESLATKIQGQRARFYQRARCPRGPLAVWFDQHSVAVWNQHEENS